MVKVRSALLLELKHLQTFDSAYQQTLTNCVPTWRSETGSNSETQPGTTTWMTPQEMATTKIPPESINRLVAKNMRKMAAVIQTKNTFKAQRGPNRSENHPPMAMPSSWLTCPVVTRQVVQSPEI